MHPGIIAWWNLKHGGHAGHGHHGHGHHGHGHHGHGRHAEGPCADGGGSWGAWGGWAEHVAEAREAHGGGDAFDGDFGGGSFGVRRPLRFLAHKLDLDDKQVDALAQILNELKTERAQAAVDHRRTVSGFADVIAGETFDGDKAGAVASDRVKSAEHLRSALVKALQSIHALLQPEQRAKLAYLIRTGALTL
jgi:Spy/CpxP family protein refolding chaperone